MGQPHDTTSGRFAPRKKQTPRFTDTSKAVGSVSRHINRANVAERDRRLTADKRKEIGAAIGEKCITTIERFPCDLAMKAEITETVIRRLVDQQVEYEEDAAR